MLLLLTSRVSVAACTVQLPFGKDADGGAGAAREKH